MQKAQNNFFLYSIFIIIFFIVVYTTNQYGQITQSPSTVGPLSEPDCIVNKKYSLERNMLSGTLIIEKQGYYSLLSLPDMTSVQLPETILEVSESPNKQILIAKQGDGAYNQISAFDARGEILNTFQRKPDWDKEWHLDLRLRWLDEQNFVVGIPPSGSKLIINAITREEQKVFLGDNNKLQFEANQSSGFVIFAPRLDQVLYKATGWVFILKAYEKSDTSMIVWAKHSTSTLATSTPAWSPNGNLIAMPIVNMDGITDLHMLEKFGLDEIKLTDFEKHYNYPMQVLIHSLAWAPDSSLIALNVHIIADEKQQKQKVIHSTGSYQFCKCRKL